MVVDMTNSVVACGWPDALLQQPCHYTIKDAPRPCATNGDG